MKLNSAILVTAFGAMTAMTTTLAETISFDQDAAGAAPSGWRTGVTGRGSPKWVIEADATAPSKPNVLKQAGSGTFPPFARIRPAGPHPLTATVLLVEVIDLIDLLRDQRPVAR